MKVEYECCRKTGQIYTNYEDVCFTVVMPGQFLNQGDGDLIILWQFTTPYDGIDLTEFDDSEDVIEAIDAAVRRSYAKWNRRMLGARGRLNVMRSVV